LRLTRHVKLGFDYLLKSFRPYEWRAYIFFTLLGFLYPTPRPRITPDNLFRLIISTSCYLSLSYWINNAYDVKSDLINPQLRSRNIFIEKSISRIMLKLVALTLLIAGFSMTIHNSISQINYLSMSLLAILYSTPPVRLKEKPPLDLISHALFFGSQLFLHGYFISHVKIKAEITQLIILVSLYSIILQLRNHIEDYFADSAAGYKTTATVLGLEKSNLLLNVLILTFLLKCILTIVDTAIYTFLLITSTLMMLQINSGMTRYRKIDALAILTLLLSTFKKYLNDLLNSIPLEMLVKAQFDLSNVIDFFKTLGLIGVFLASFIGNATPYVGLPYLLVVIEYSALVKLSFNEIIAVTLIGGLGSAAGKMVILFMGHALNRFLSEETRRNVQRFSKLFEKSLFTAIFIFAALPLPDDILYVPISISKYNPYKFFTAVFLGKTIIVGATAMIGRGISIALGENPLFAGLTSIILSILILVLIVKLDWERIIMKVNEVGWLDMMVELMKNPGEYLK